MTYSPPAGTRKRIQWNDLSDGHLLEIVQQRYSEMSPKQLEDKKNGDPALYAQLAIRKLLPQADLLRQRQNWQALTDQHILEIVQQRYSRMSPNKLASKKGDRAVYTQLAIRKLLRQAFPNNKYAQSAKCNLPRQNVQKESLARHSKYSRLDRESFKNEVDSLGITRRMDLQKHRALYRKGSSEEGWFDYVFGSPQNNRGRYKNWTAEIFKEDMVRRGIKTRVELQKLPGGLYARACKEGWIDLLSRTVNDYSNWTEDRFRKEVVKRGAKGIGDLPTQMQKVAKEKGWLYSFFGKQPRNDYSDWTLERYKTEIEALNIKKRTQLSRSLHNLGRRQGWLDIVFGPTEHPHRNYDGWTVETFKQELDSLGIKNRIQLLEHSGLYAKGYAMGWVDAVFRRKKIGSLDDILDDYIGDSEC